MVHLTLNDWSRGEQRILFPENLNVSRDEVHCSPRDQSLSDLLSSNTVAHICKHNKQFLKHNKIFFKDKSIFVKHKPKLSKHNTKLSKHNTKLSKHNTKLSKHNTKLSKHNTKLSKHNTKLSKHNTKLSKLHKILAGRSGKPRYESMKTRQVSNMAITHGKKTRTWKCRPNRREAVCLYRMIPFTWHDKFSLQILRSLVSFSVDIRPFR